MKRSGLARVAALYEQVERVRLVELQQAANAVDTIERVRREAAADCDASRLEGRAALVRGEVAGWRMAESVVEAAEVRAARAVELRAECEELRAEAGEQYRVSRLQTERVARVVHNLESLEAGKRNRREQADADDRFAARLCWSRMKPG